MWCGFTATTFIGPLFFEEMRDPGFETASMADERYGDMLQNRIIPSLADKYLLYNASFMQDDSPPHIPRQVKYPLSRLFGDDRVLNCHFRHA